MSKILNAAAWLGYPLSVSPFGQFVRLTRSDHKAYPSGYQKS